MPINGRNYRKNPHTASFLMRFHTAGAGLPADADGAEFPPARPEPQPTPGIQRVREARGVAFVMNQEVGSHVKVIAGHEVRIGDGFVSEKQATWIIDIATTREIPAGRTAESVLLRLKQGFAKSAGTQFITSYKDLPKKAAPAPVLSGTASAPVEIEPNYYGIVRDGEVKIYAIDHGKVGGKWEGFTFVKRVSSDEEFSIRNKAERAAILAAIAEDVDGAAILAAHTIRKCRRCHRRLTDTKNPYFGMGLGPECGAK